MPNPPQNTSNTKKADSQKNSHQSTEATEDEAIEKYQDKLDQQWKV
jgi:hypothetical protein